MVTCKECAHFFPLEEDPNRGDCIRRVVDERQGYWRAEPVEASRDASKCQYFEKK